MNLLVLAVFVAAPTDAPATAHEKVLEPQFKQFATTDLPKSIWRLDNSDGVHAQSTLVCPASVGRFERSQLVPFDNFGLDVGCNFDASGIGRVTLYLTRRTGRPLSDDFNAADAALKQNMTDVQPVVGGLPAPSGLPFTSAVYARPDGSRTGLWVADVSGWTFKFRATYTAERESDALGAMTALTAKMSETAGKHLGACAAAAPVARTGTTITDKDQNGSLAIMAGILSAAGDAGDKAGTPVAEQWCAEEAAGDRETPLLFWRNTKADADAGPADRISLMTVGEPPMLISSGNPLLGEVEKGIKGPLYELDAYQGTTAFVFAFFAGRPAAATLSPIAKDIFLGKRNPLASYDTKSNTITISSDAAKPGERPMRVMVREGGPPTPYRDFGK